MKLWLNLASQTLSCLSLAFFSCNSSSTSCVLCTCSLCALYFVYCICFILINPTSNWLKPKPKPKPKSKPKTENEIVPTKFQVVTKTSTKHLFYPRNILPASSFQLSASFLLFPLVFPYNIIQCTSKMESSRRADGWMDRWMYLLSTELTNQPTNPSLLLMTIYAFQISNNIDFPNVNQSFFVYVMEFLNLIIQQNNRESRIKRTWKIYKYIKRKRKT